MSIVGCTIVCLNNRMGENEYKFIKIGLKASELDSTKFSFFFGCIGVMEINQ